MLKKFKSYYTKLLLCTLLTFNTACNNIHNVQNNDETPPEFNEDENIKEAENFSPGTNSTQEYFTTAFVSNSEIIPPATELKTLIETNPKIIFKPAIDRESISIALSKIKNIAKYRNGLKTGSWLKKNKQIYEGLMDARDLQVISNNFETVIERYLPIEKLIEIIESFEETFNYWYQKYSKKEISSEDFNEHLKDFGLYTVSLVLLKAMLETKEEDGTFRYVGNEEKNGKKLIPEASAKIIKEKVTQFVHAAESIYEESLLRDKKITKLTTPVNIIANTNLFDELESSIGGRLSPVTFDEDHRFDYKRKLIPDSILFTWLNSKKLSDGSFFHSLGMKSKENSIVSIMHDLLNLRDEYIKFSDQLKIFKDTFINNCSEMDTIVKNYIVELKTNENFKRAQQNGGKAISNLRKVIEQTKLYQIQGRVKKTLGREFVGHWVGSDDRKRISVKQAEKLELELDFLSSIHAYIESEGIVHCDIEHNKSMRGESKFWCFETEQEQKDRENNKRAHTQMILSQALGVVLALSGFIPFIGPTANTAFFVMRLAVISGFIGSQYII